MTVQLQSLQEMVKQFICDCYRSSIYIDKAVLLYLTIRPPAILCMNKESYGFIAVC